ncbi:unnamed protein product [Arctogadus glacialis]
MACCRFTLPGSTGPSSLCKELQSPARLSLDCGPKAKLKSKRRYCHRGKHVVPCSGGPSQWAVGLEMSGRRVTRGSAPPAGLPSPGLPEVLRPADVGAGSAAASRHRRCGSSHRPRRNIRWPHCHERHLPLRIREARCGSRSGALNRASTQGDGPPWALFGLDE